MQKWPDSRKQLFCLLLFLLNFAHLLVLHKFDEIRELELFFARMFEDFTPLLEGVQENFLAIELVLLGQYVNLGFLTEAVVVEHWHALVLRLLDQALDPSV